MGPSATTQLGFLLALLPLAFTTAALDPETPAPDPPNFPMPAWPPRPPQPPHPNRSPTSRLPRFPSPPFPPDAPYPPWEPDLSSPPVYPPPAPPPKPLNASTALLTLKTATKPSSWAQAGINWNASMPSPCAPPGSEASQWTGVACAEDGNVSSLALRNMSLSLQNVNGSLPWQLGWLTNLTQLDLSYNQYGGGLPSFWSSLAALTFLDLSQTLIRGPVPWSWATGMLAMNSTPAAFINLTGLDLCGYLPPGLNISAPPALSPRLGYPCKYP